MSRVVTLDVMLKVIALESTGSSRITGATDDRLQVAQDRVRFRIIVIPITR
jgi:hypothetical protein